MSTLRQIPWALGATALAALGVTLLGLGGWGFLWLLENTWLGDAVLAVVTWSGLPVVIVVVVVVWFVAKTRADYLQVRSRQVHAASMHGTSCSCGLHGCTGRVGHSTLAEADQPKRPVEPKSPTQTPGPFPWGSGS